MKTINREQLLEQLNWRYATKQFDPSRKISREDWETLEQSLVLTPSSFGLQPWQFIVVDDPKLRSQLVGASWDQRQVAEASHLLVFAVKTELDANFVDIYLKRIAEVRGVTPVSLTGFRQVMLESIVHGRSDEARKTWAVNQVYIALGNFMTSAALLGIDVCPMEGIEQEKYNDILGLKKLGLSAIVVAAAGYRSENDKYASLPKVRFRVDEVVSHVE